MKKKGGKSRMNEKVTFWKIAVISVFIFLFGYFMGNVFDLNKIRGINLEGYQYNALEDVNATTADATSCNATTSDATSCNATSSDATSSNATSSNISTNNTNSNTNTNNTNTTTPDQTANNGSVSFENNKITVAQIKEINDSTKSLNVTLNCDTNPVVSSSIFAAVKESNSKLILVYGENKMTFLGSDITQPKDIDFKVSVSDINTNDTLKEFTSSGLVVEFPDNNKLPGDALVSINIDSQYNDYFSNGVLFVYYYNESTDKLELVASDIKITDNIAEFTINHNSSFILTNSTVSQENATKDTSNKVVRFVNNNLIYIIVIGVSIILIITVTVIVLVQRKKKFGKMF